MLSLLESRLHTEGYPSGRRRRFFDDLERNPESLGCVDCSHRGVCGGLHVESAFDCLDYCCRRPASCDSVCVVNPSRFVRRLREVEGFEFDSIPRSHPIPRPALPNLIPLVYHGSSRTIQFIAPTVALSLYSLIDRRAEELKYLSRELLCQAFRICPQSPLLITGTHSDPSLERWWGFGPQRKKILHQLAGIGIAAITTPNFSLFSNTPRWDDLHSMKRIAITWQEMMAAGLPSGLHVNARTDHDWCRWRDFINQRPEVNLLAFEFATGASNPERKRWYTDQLCRLATDVDRPLTLVIRGGTSVVSQLRESYAAVSLVDTTPFIKAIRRQRASLRTGGGIDWESMAGNGIVSVDELLAHNYRAVSGHRLAPHTGCPHRD